MALRSYSGYATTFGDPADIDPYYAAIDAGKGIKQALNVGDPGVGASRLGELDTSKTYGVAVPESYLRNNLGSDPAAWRTARALVNFSGQNVRVPIIDLGPGSGPMSHGVVTDLSYPLAQRLGATGSDPVNYQLMPNAGPDYTIDRDAFNQEQDAISSGLTAATDPDPDASYVSDAVAQAQLADTLSGFDWSMGV
jgi:hypothetical protein